jgi:glucose uptake protein
MFIVGSYSLAVVLCFVTMLCWGSWANTQKLASSNWRFELFYWDYVIGTLVFALFFAFTFGSIGNSGRPFLEDLAQANKIYLFSAVMAGVIFNLGNILLCAGVALSGLAVAFPLGVGTALVFGTIVIYFEQKKGNPVLLFIGIALIVFALVCNGFASSAATTKKTANSNKKGIILAVLGGIVNSFFYRFVASSMDLNNFKSPQAGKLTPYTALVIFTIGIFISNFLFNTFAMKKPVLGSKVNYSDYFKGKFGTHLVGILGGVIWCLGTGLSYLSSGVAGAAISYALGQGAPMIAAAWGIFIWKEFKNIPADKKKLINLLNLAMFILFILGLILVIISGAN